MQGKPEHVIGANPSIIDVLQWEHLVEPLEGVFIGLKLAHSHAEDAALWRGLVALCRDAVLDFLEWKARHLLHNGSFPLELLSFPLKA